MRFRSEVLTKYIYFNLRNIFRNSKYCKLFAIQEGIENVKSCGLFSQRELSRNCLPYRMILLDHVTLNICS